MKLFEKKLFAIVWAHFSIKTLFFFFTALSVKGADKDISGNFGNYHSELPVVRLSKGGNPCFNIAKTFTQLYAVVLASSGFAAR